MDAETETNLSHILANDKKYEDFNVKNSDSYNDIERALEVVKSFIIRKKLILYGGMAVDLALKAAKHKGIYDDNAVPDYDFYSPDFYNDSNELADIFEKKGFTSISSINAMHVSTRRVRINFIVVADVSYIPPEIFKNIPTMVVQGMRIVHPNFQRMDFHRSMTYAFEKPPLEVMLHRGYKDQKRFPMIAKQYPIGMSKLTQGASVWTIPIKYLDNNVLSGVQTYCVLYQIMDEIVNGKSRLAKTIQGVVKDISNVKHRLASLPKGSFEFSKTGKTSEQVLQCKLDKESPCNYINIITDNVKSLEESIVMKSKKPTVKYYNQYIDDLRPKTTFIQDANYELFDNHDRKLPVFELKSVLKLLNCENPAARFIKICGCHNLMLYFLQKYFDHISYTPRKVNKSEYLTMYAAVFELVSIAEVLYTAAVSSKGENATNDIFKALPFFLSTNTYGASNNSADYLAMVIEKNDMINYTPRDQREDLRPPFGYYPDSMDKALPFKPSDSRMFAFDGNEVKKSK